MPQKKKTKPNAKAAKTAKRQKSSRWGRIAFALLVVMTVIALGFFLVLREEGQQSVAENAVGTVFQPVENALSTVTRGIRGIINGARDYWTISENYQVAQQENMKLRMQLEALEEAQQENKRLNELLDAKTLYSSSDPVFARVIGRDPGVWFETFTIDRGTKDGVGINMAVITGDGLVGRILEVGLNYSKVMSVIDTRSSVACLIERTRDNGVMHGEIASDSVTDECNMYYLPKINDIIPGDVVLTSGKDGIFPKGLTVGTVKAVARQSDLSDQYIVVAPSVDFLHVEEVLVLREETEDEEGSHAVLHTPTPRPTAEPTPGTGEEEPEPTPDDPNEQTWTRPSAMPDTDEIPETESGAEPTPTPAPSIDPSGLKPEDIWTT